MRHPLQRFSTWLFLSLSLLAALLAGVLWYQNSQYSDSEEALDRLGSQRTQLQQELSNLDPQNPAKDASAQTVRAGNSSTPKADEKDEERTRERKQAYKDFLKQLTRRNALRLYRPGLESLHLPPQTLAQAKTIILANWEARDAAYKKVSTSEERLAIATQMAQKEADQLTPLLGAEGYATVKASTLSAALDWTIGTDMWDNGAPLNQEQLQAIALAQLRTQAKRAHWSMEPLPSQIPDVQTQLSAQDTALLAASAGALSPKQQEILRRSLIEENQYNAAMRTFIKEQQQVWKAQNSGGN